MPLPDNDPLERDFRELLDRARHGREFSHASFEPIYYLVYKPSLILEVKRRTVAWLARLRYDGWDAETFSIAEAVADVLDRDPMRPIWLKADQANPLAWDKINSSLALSIAKGGVQRALEAKLEAMAARRRPMLLVTDLEALHPYAKIGAIENNLYGKFKSPTVFLYPGSRSGKTGLSFLGFYPNDGNYRSVHIGG